RLEGNPRVQLDNPETCRTADEGAERRRRRSHGRLHRSEQWVGNIAHWLVEVRMIQDVEEVRADSQRSAFPLRNVEVLRHREIGVEESRSAELVAALVQEAERRNGNAGEVTCNFARRAVRVVAGNTARAGQRRSAKNSREYLRAGASI